MEKKSRVTNNCEIWTDPVTLPYTIDKITKNLASRGRSPTNQHIVFNLENASFSVDFMVEGQTGIPNILINYCELICDG